MGVSGNRLEHLRAVVTGLCSRHSVRMLQTWFTGRTLQWRLLLRTVLWGSRFVWLTISSHELKHRRDCCLRSCGQFRDRFSFFFFRVGHLVPGPTEIINHFFHFSFWQMFYFKNYMRLSPLHTFPKRHISSALMDTCTLPPAQRKRMQLYPLSLPVFFYPPHLQERSVKYCLTWNRSVRQKSWGPVT